ncbi:Zinc finger cchc domain-containing protein [Thalictrum thalictroides]|uniref:Zinc finger cchc domain-containing protein n=1 Tax=Thalictrum thalictroides TaxID=46969 RepID=A0A7J6VHQ2_THATH|nr:Zinc finger cchc domain-containing protein [Thalictrum thalictroides]
MASEDFIQLGSSSDLMVETEKIEADISTNQPSEADAPNHISPPKEDIVNEETSSQGIEDGEIEEGQFEETMELDNQLAHEPISHVGFNLVGTVKESEKTNRVSSGVNGGDGCTEHNDHISLSNHSVDESPLLGVKRARMTYVDREASVHVEYKSLTRASKRKLEELLQHWSQWHAQQKFPTDDSREPLESGKQTVFPALYFGLEKASSVSFWMDNQTAKEQNQFIPLDGDSVPMYDRGFALGLTADDGSTNMEGGMETREASRCFNCGSYSHALRDCHRPRDNAAVDSARKQHNSKRNQTAGPRNPLRYYQDSPGGKYDGIKPGVLGSETRQLLGLGELDPPPWLHRMREIGYPVGYLDPDYEDQPSGITIYADEKTKDGEEDGEILDTNNPEPKKKMTVEFPGINAPIPENADERRWTPLPEASSFDSSRHRSHPRDSRRSRDYRDDGPPGVDSPRYTGYDPSYASDSYSPRGLPIPNLGRSLSDRGRWNPLVHDDSPSDSPVKYASPSSVDSRNYGSHHKSSSDSSSRRNDRHDHPRHRRI